MLLSQPFRVHALWALQHSADAPALEHPFQRQLQHNGMRRAGRHGFAIHHRRIHAKGSLPCFACMHAVTVERHQLHQAEDTQGVSMHGSSNGMV